MPIYHYKCSCGYDDEIYHSIKEDIRKICPSCSHSTLYVVIDSIPYGKVEEVKTLGQLMEKNSKKLGKELVQKKMEQDGITELNKKREEMAEMRKIANFTPEQKEKYIMEGRL